MTTTCGRGPTNPAVGRWFPSGFHGHFRSKSRNDFICEFRQLARPQPPEKFIRRLSVTPSKNVFSRHDNRNSFLADAEYFEQGHGRRRMECASVNKNPDLLTWRPSQSEPRRKAPNLSYYQTNYQGSGMEQVLVKPLRSSFDECTSTYRYVHGLGNPHKDALEAMNKDALRTSFFNRKAGQGPVPGRDSVASCLSWATPTPPARISLLQCGRHAPCTPHPPSLPKPGGSRPVPAATAICPPSTPPTVPPIAPSSDIPLHRA